MNSTNNDKEIVLNALRTRRSVPRVTDERPPKALIEQIIEAGTWGPNHYRTRPWHFVVITGSARNELGLLMAESLRARLEQPDSAEAQPLIEREARKPLRAPVIIAVAAIPSEMPKVREIEEIAGVAAGIQNMLIAAEAVGLSAMWRTGEPAYDPRVKRFLGLPEHSHLLAFLYVGYGDISIDKRRASEGEDHTRWLEWED